MTTHDILDLAGTNLIDTYFQLAEATPGARLIQAKGFRASVGQVNHPVCNFAADLDLDPESAESLRSLAAGYSRFNVYSLPDDRPGNVLPLLESVGFRRAYSLTQMVAQPQDSIDEFPMESARTPAERTEVARFMVDQFFGRQSGSFRQAVAQSTAAAEGLSLCFRRQGGSIVAAVMLLRQPHVLGVYNLCVSPPLRRRGLGSKVVAWARAQAQDSIVALQCDPRLTKWYASAEFRSVGAVSVYSLPDGAQVDIMGLG